MYFTYSSRVVAPITFTRAARHFGFEDVGSIEAAAAAYEEVYLVDEEHHVGVGLHLLDDDFLSLSSNCPWPRHRQSTGCNRARIMRSAAAP